MRRVLPLFAVLCLAFAPAPFPRTMPAALKTLQGEWTLVSETGDGVKQAAKKVSMAFYARHITLTDRHGTYRWELAVDPASSSKAFDLWLVTHNGKSWHTRYIYSIKGDTLTTCYNATKPSIRPGEMSGNGPLLLQVWRRKKP